MNEWKVIWFDGSSLRETVIPACDFYSLPSFASSYGVNIYAITGVERIARS